MNERLAKALVRLRHDENGAILLAVLASFLILFMAAMVVYDAGRSAQDKMDVQFAADSAAFSHSVVKARTMNLIAYTNTIKRQLFSYLAAYANAWIAIVITFAHHWGECFCGWCIPDIDSCISVAVSLPMMIMEGLELLFENLPATAGSIFYVLPNFFQNNATPSKEELEGLDHYQQYMYSVTPWWSYVEGALRGMRDGAYIAGSWPPPTADYTQVHGVAGVSTALGAADSVFGTGFAGANASPNVDALPVARRDRADNSWGNPDAPFVYDGGTRNAGPHLLNNFGDAFDAGLGYCLNYAVSIESLVSLAQVVMESDDQPNGWKMVFAISHLLPSIGCAFAAAVYTNWGYLDWRIHERFADGNNQRWWKATSSLSMAYKPRAGRNDDATERQKYNTISREAAWDRNAYGNEGYFGMARSEIVFKQPFQFLNVVEDWVNQLNGFLPGLGGFVAQRAGIQDSPDMWSPRWKAKNRPVMLPGEQFGSAIGSGDVGFNVVTRDLLPWVALANAAGLVPGGQRGTEIHSAASSARDIAYLFRAGSDFGTNESQGLAK